MDLAVAQQLVTTVGPIGAMMIIGAWWYATHQEKRNGHVDREAQSKARDAIIQISADVKHMKDDIDEIKLDGKETARVLLEHIAAPHTRRK